VVEEALTNAHKYGDGQATVHIRRDPEAIDVHVENLIDQRKVDAASQTTLGGHGLIGMRERVTAMAGRVELEQAHDRFVVHVTVPSHRNPSSTGRPA
jgi:signal transduction histidine kinase